MLQANLTPMLTGGGVCEEFSLGDKISEGKVHRYFRMSLRNMRFVKHYPSEAICEPLFRTWFFFWKAWNKKG